MWIKNVLIGLFFTLSLHGADRVIVIHGCSHLLELYSADGELLSSYPVGVGGNGLYKTTSGDKKTPIGEYTILWKASRFAKDDGGALISDEVGYYVAENQYSTLPTHDSISIGTESYGGKEAIFMSIDYPNAKDLSQGHTGHGIAIHAALEGIGKNSSLGCIRMHPADARDLYLQIEAGTKVFIKDD